MSIVAIRESAEQFANVATPAGGTSAAALASIPIVVIEARARSRRTSPRPPAPS